MILSPTTGLAFLKNLSGHPQKYLEYFFTQFSTTHPNVDPNQYILINWIYLMNPNKETTYIHMCILPLGDKEFFTLPQDVQPFMPKEIIPWILLLSNVGYKNSHLFLSPRSSLVVSRCICDLCMESIAKLPSSGSGQIPGKEKNNRSWIQFIEMQKTISYRCMELRKIIRILKRYNII